MSTVCQPEQITFELGNEQRLKEACTAPGLPPFSPKVLDFLEELSHALRALPVEERSPDLMTFAFWCRRAHLEQLRPGGGQGELRLGRGFTLQITPGNVPLNFAFSMVAGLLAGNANGVRLSAAATAQGGLLCRTMETLLRQRYPELQPYLVCFRCDHDSPVLAELSACCAVRVIWGGDGTIEALRRLPLPPRAVELTFADRYSLSVFRAEAWLAADNRDGLAAQFAADAYWSDQLACTAPRGILWLGERTDEARTDFWSRVEQAVRRTDQMAAVTAVRKREALLLLALQDPTARLCGTGNRVVRVQVGELTPAALAACPGGGFFLEQVGQSVKDLLPVAGPACQTVTSLGVSRAEWAEFLGRYKPGGIDRVTPLGHAADFSLTWDGYDLIGMMSRLVSMTL